MRGKTSRTTLALLASAMITTLLAPTDAEACVWGSFDASRINYAGGPLTGTAHDSFRAIIQANGDTLAAATPTIDDAYLAGVDIFYTSLLSTQTGTLSPAEQTSLQNWIAAGGTLIVSADIFPLAAYESFTSVYGVTGYQANVAGSTANVVDVHPLVAGVNTLQFNTASTFTFGGDAMLLAEGAQNAESYMIVMEPSTGFNVGGRVVVFGDHNGFTDSTIAQQDNTQFVTNLVSWACSLCGNGVVDQGEGCDDGNADNTDDCLTTCEPASCGDGFVWDGNETCDDGNDVDTDDCPTTCEQASCGDGFLWDGNEVCDDGNLENTDACLDTCEEASCGDGFVWDGVEGCDDANMENTDACLDTCEEASCGDGFVWNGVEGCDDQNADNMDGCLDTCELASCGDGFVEDGVEACDDGNADNTDACLDTCAEASCGDGFVWEGAEVCDDGVNDGSYGGCAEDCSALGPFCGDGSVDEEGGEECDDGDDDNDNECANDCTANAETSTTGGDSNSGTGTGPDTSAGPTDSDSTDGTDGSDGTTSGSSDGDTSTGAEDDGCGCAAGEEGRGGPGLLALALLGLLRRRRR